MFGLHSLDVGIGLILVYLILSLACTGFNEFIANLTSGRSVTLREGLMRVLDDDAIRRAFFHHSRGHFSGGAVLVRHPEQGSQHSRGRPEPGAEPQG
jgi:hypothetical protein